MSEPGMSEPEIKIEISGDTGYFLRDDLQNFSDEEIARIMSANGIKKLVPFTPETMDLHSLLKVERENAETFYRISGQKSWPRSRPIRNFWREQFAAARFRRGRRENYASAPSAAARTLYGQSRWLNRYGKILSIFARSMRHCESKVLRPSNTSEPNRSSFKKALVERLSLFGVNEKRNTFASRSLSLRVLESICSTGGKTWPFFGKSGRAIEISTRHRHRRPRAATLEIRKNIEIYTKPVIPMCYRSRRDRR